MPPVSVVVATRNRAGHLPGLVAALAAQVGAPAFEVVVVDDASTDATPAVLADLSATARVPLRTARLAANGGPAAARNAGWRASGGDLVAFTDDDCVPAPGWLAALVAAAGAGAGIVQGRTEAGPGERGWFSHTVEVARESGFYETCNIAYRRRWLEEVDGFDEGFHLAGRRGAGGPMWGEDTDLAWRARAAGATTVFAPDALVVHEVRTTSAGERLRSLHRREGVVRLVRRHPGIRATFPGGWWFQPEHGPVLLAAAGVALAATGSRSPGRWAVAAVAAVPYARRRVARLDRGRRLTLLPHAVAYDLGEVLVLARASLRHRTLVL